MKIHFTNKLNDRAVVVESEVSLTVEQEMMLKRSVADILFPQDSKTATDLVDEFILSSGKNGDQNAIHNFRDSFSKQIEITYKD